MIRSVATQKGARITPGGGMRGQRDYFTFFQLCIKSHEKKNWEKDWREGVDGGEMWYLIGLDTTNLNESEN